jgi:hypothetical protein
MLEAARIIGFFSALLLVASVVIWAKRLRGPLLQRLDGRIASNGHPAQIACRLLVAAVGLSALAALLAIAGWFSA